MKTINTTLKIDTSYPLMTPYTWEDLIFFDIETTGFSAHTSYLYLIGCMYYKDNTWQMTQWLADDMNSEALILESFFKLLGSYKRLVHFNGSGFDIPFIREKCRQHQNGLSFEGIESYDIYKKVLPVKKLLPLPNYKLKTIEKFVGLNRTDTYGGEELIQVYANYLGRLQYEKLLEKGSQNQSFRPKSNTDNSISHIDRDNTKNLSSDELSKILLLHNLEDVTGLLQVADILFYPDLFENCPFQSVSLKEETAGFADGLTAPVPDQRGTSRLILTMVLPHALPKPVSLITPIPEILPAHSNNPGPQNEDFSIRLLLKEDLLTLKLPVYEGELKYFFENYRDYFYLPKEDTAIHKSIAQYVDKEFKVKAKPANCYNKKPGRFIPQTENLFTPGFKNNLADKITYFELTDPVLKDTARWRDYINSILHYILTNKATGIIS